MQFKKSVELDAPPARIWAVLWDIPRITRCIPGCQEVRVIEDNKRYEATMVQQVGQFRSTFEIDAHIDEVKEGRLIRAHGVGRDRNTNSHLYGRLEIRLGADGNGSSSLDVDSDVQIAGRLAAMGRGIVERLTAEVFDEFVERLSTELRTAASGGA